MDLGPEKETAKDIQLTENISISSHRQDNNNTNNISHLFSNIGSNNFIFRDSDSRCSTSNENEDDSKKRQGVG